MEKIVIYTALFGNYDVLSSPINLSKDFDYICFTDKPKKIQSPWMVKFIKPIYKPSKMNRMIKINPHLFLKKYEISIYLDSNVFLISDPKKLIKKFLNKKDIVAPLHRYRKDFKEEINAIESYSRLNPSIGKKIRKIYKYEINQVKINWLTENRLLIRRHNKKRIINLMNSWWKEYLKGITRDQVSFPIVCYRNKIKPGFIKSYIRYIDCFLVKPHRSSNFYWQAQYIIFFKLYQLILTLLKK